MLFRPSHSCVLLFVCLIAFTHSDFTSGNLLLTQPNEIFTKHFLAEFTTKGDEVAYYDFNDKLPSNPVDFAFFDKQAYVLADLDGVFLVNQNAEIIRAFGKQPWPFVNHSNFIFEFSTDGRMFVVDLGTNMKRHTHILEFDANEEYKGIFLDLGAFVPTNLLATTDGFLWMSQGPTRDDPVVRKYSLKDASLVGSYKSTLDVEFYGGMATDGKEIYVSSQGLSGLSYDHVTVFGMDGTVKREWNLYPKGEIGAAPAGMVLSQEKLYIEFSDPFESSRNETQHVQVYDATTGSFELQFGGHDCSDLLCQTFNGLALVP